MQAYKGKKLLLFGDSVMYGSGNGGFGVGEYLEKDLGLKLAKYCIGGARTGFYEGKNWIVEQLREAVNNNETADIIVFDGFTNDCYKTDGKNCDVPLGEISDKVFDIFDIGNSANFSECFESIVCAFGKYFPTAKVLFVRPHRMGRREEGLQITYGERAVEICKKFNISVCDLYKDSGLDTFLPDDRDKYTNDSYGWGRGDCTHPNALGYEKKYMPLIERAVKELL
ncbi:MAG: SGNH/GDSL hydrolase family protein [Clostridia bacterium]|nr:SGNH/GDSL hydrolase family protein [Clostridia bacterium]